MGKNSRKWWYLLPIIILSLYSGVLWKVSAPSNGGTFSNDITSWTNGFLTNDTYLKCDIQTFVGENAHTPQTNIYFWVIAANSSSMVAVKTTISPGPRGTSLSQVLDILIYKESSWNLYPFSINVPNAIQSFETKDPWTVLTVKKGWDTYYIKFKKEIGERKHVYKWYLDRDTHLTDKIQITHYKPNISDTRMVLEVKESSVGIVDDNEVKVIGLFGTYSALILLPFTSVVALSKSGEKNPIQMEKQRLESRKFKQQFIKKHREDKKQS